MNPSDQTVKARPADVEQLRKELAEARDRVEALTAKLREQQVASRQVEQARKAWAQTVDALSQPIFMHDENDCVVRANRAYAERAGLPVKNLIGRVYWKLFPQRDGAFELGTEEGDAEFEFALSPDEIFLVRSVGASAGLPMSWRLYVFDDITELKRTAAAARASGQYATSIVESSIAAIVAVDRDRRIVEFNPAAERSFGYSRDEVLGQHVNLLYADAEQGEVARQLLFERGGTVGEVENRRKNGEAFTSLMSGTVLRDADGKALGILGTSLDITERKKAEEKLREALRELELGFENAMVGMAFVRDRVFQRVNRNFAEMLGYNKAELVGRSTALAYASGEDYEQVGREAYPELAKGKGYEADVRFKRKDGALCWVHLAGRSVARDKGETGAIWVCEDITERKASSERLERGAAYFRALFEGGMDATMVVKADGTIDYESSASEGVLGYGAEKRVGRSSFEYVHADDLERVLQAHQHVVRGKVPWLEVEFRQRHSDGGWRLMSGTFAAAAGQDGETVDVVRLRDVTEKRRDERRLEESLEEALVAIAATVEMRDPYAAGHQRNVCNLAVAIAREMGVDAQRVHGLRLAAAVHDIGNIQIPDEILTKPGKLTELEYAFVQTHPQAGHDILKDIDFPWPIAQTVLQHHELLDGSGYPRGLKGDQILLEARILTVANVVTAMTSPRAFLPPAGVDAALEEITRFRGVKFDADVVDACVRVFRDMGFSFDKS